MCDAIGERFYYLQEIDSCDDADCGPPEPVEAVAPFDSIEKCAEACLESLWWKRALRRAGVPLPGEAP